VVDAFVRADWFDHTGAAAGMNGAEPGWFFNRWAIFCYRLAAHGGA
jgi:hypothetical protein